RSPAVKRVLVIDDSDLVVEALRNKLGRDGIIIESIADISTLDGERRPDFRLGDFDLVLMDVQMPAWFDESVEAATRQRETAPTPIVLLSSLPEAQLATRVEQKGLDGYILKALGVDGVAEEVRAWIYGRKPRRGGGP